MSSGSVNFLGIKITANLCFCCHAENKCYQCWLMLDLYGFVLVHGEVAIFLLPRDAFVSDVIAAPHQHQELQKIQGAVAIHVHVLASCEVQSLRSLRICDFDGIFVWIMFVHLNHLTLLASFCTLWLCDVCVSPWVSTASQLVLPQKNWSEKHFTKLSLIVSPCG